MTDAEFGAAERDLLIERHRRARRVRNDALDAHAAKLGVPGEIGIDESSEAYLDTPEYRQARQAYAEMEAVEREYFARLPRPVMAPCPFCALPLHRSFDPFGINGLWWRGDAQPEEPAPCPHFCVLLGAVALSDQRPVPDFDVEPGPGTPFVVPRLLLLSGMTAIVSQIPLRDGSTAFPIAYFAPRRPPVQALTAAWARTAFVYTTQLGEHSWRHPEVPGTTDERPVWDFDLLPWLESGQLRWCEPGSDRTTVAEASPARCPFLGHQGTRAPQLILGGW